MQKKVFVKNEYNKNLSVIINLPEENLKDIVIVSHCFTCSKSYKLYNSISKTLTAKGYGVVRYDVMGLGNSAGDFSKTSFSTNVEDLVSIYNYMSKNYKQPRYLFGHSIGSLVSIKAANKLDAVIGVATVGGPSDFTNLLRLYSYHQEELIKNERITAKIGGRDIKIGIDYLEDMKKESISQIITNFNKSIIMFHSNTDQTVSYKDGLKLFNSLTAKKSFVTLDNVDHLVKNKKDSQYIGEILYLWLENFNL